MKCTKCGAPLMDDSNFCEVCGAKITNNETRTTYNGQTPFMEKQQGFESQILNYYVNPGFNVDRIRKWFLGNPLLDLLCLLAILSGLVFCFISPIMHLFLRDRSISMLGVGFGIVFGGILAKIIINQRQEDNVEEIEQAWKTYTNILSQRGMQKLNLIQEEVSLLEPIVLIGRGASPNDSYVVSKEKEKAANNIFTRITENNDPIEVYKIDKYNIFRSMLLQVSVYMFSGEQVFAYVGNIDISTGLIYKEGTSEVFFHDIEGVAFKQEVLKIYNERTKVRDSKIMETFVLYLAGCKLKSSILLEENDMSVIENQLVGMRNLIRDKKNED